MNSNDVTGALNEATGWFADNQELLLQYVVNIVSAFVILIIGLIISKWVGRGIQRVMTLRGIDKTVSDFLSAIVRYAIVAFTLIAVLGKIGVQTASVIAVIGAAGLAVGLALQNSLGNFAAGVLLVVFRPIRAGEYIIAGSVEGTVQYVQIFSTTLKSADDRIIVIPNGKMLNDNIINTSREPNRRTQMIIGVAYDSDIDEVKKVLGDIVAADNRVLHNLGVTIRLNEMSPSSLDYVVRYWSSNADALPIYWDLMENFKRALDKHGIGIPFPQMDVYLHQQAQAAAKKQPSDA
ncbi:small-conductance mechanosensitive channel MscS [Moellerella wisconsensis]|uniref:Small-conductance mechanosensitive channel n=3 Tax=Moellerella wisconsensis TaxID=158849 RepID=A0A0N0Z8B6_9GAMM|nr:small-conductance mechanosensitive channel MscS [Moellerella wisconsensis]KLN97607.1 mechanosensitive ion channel protein MscS [Moellerella wisconsensis]KPD03259.1 mechanosensitive channel stability protein [Moellerella wisconsensis ATCC 35017]UNH23378.1 small-conductance mechanosensitive channel MscS [Moellerella wisconsensis]UNH26457.1 small-conductance mechanosensitive channel MscS [Moellerella wisconsensis]UNH29874.1 small-conductance mechanosensitive channel MscS [Moellerella wisconsen